MQVLHRTNIRYNNRLCLRPKLQTSLKAQVQRSTRQQCCKRCLTDRGKVNDQHQLCCLISSPRTSNEKCYDSTSWNTFNAASQRCRCMASKRGRWLRYRNHEWEFRPLWAFCWARKPEIFKIKKTYRFDWTTKNPYLNKVKRTLMSKITRIQKREFLRACKSSGHWRSLRFSKRNCPKRWQNLVYRARILKTIQKNRLMKTRLLFWTGFHLLDLRPLLSFILNTTLKCSQNNLSTAKTN